MKSLAFAPILAALATATCLRGQEPGEAATQAALTRFAWPVPATVQVTETALKNGKEAKMRYELRISRREDGHLRIRYGDFEFLEMAGMDVSSERMQKLLAPVFAMTSAIPDYVVNEDGEFVQADGIDEMVERVAGLLAATRGEEGEKEAERLAEAMKRPETRELLSAAVANYWNAWVGAWLGWDVPSGESAAVDTSLPFGGVEIPARLAVTHHGDAAGEEGCLRLSQRTVAEGPEVAKAVAHVVARMAGEAANEEPGDVSVVNEVEIVTDPKTLCPRSVRTSKVIRLTPEGATEPREQVERHHYVFDWGRR